MNWPMLFELLGYGSVCLAGGLFAGWIMWRAPGRHG